jgi:hypothetical protein
MRASHPSDLPSHHPMLGGHRQVLSAQRPQPPAAAARVRFAERGGTPEARATVGTEEDGHDYELETELQEHSAARIDDSTV